jgi:hypothetical protein
MALVQQTFNEEFLVRWNPAGLQGAHIVAVSQVIDDSTGQVVPGTGHRLDPRPVALTDGAALSAISSEINTAALADNAAKDVALQAAVDAQKAAETARDAALAQVDALNARIAELQPPAVNGVPQEVTMRQAQLALLATKLADGSSLLDHVDAAIAAMTGDAGRAAQITWGKSADVLRTNPLIAQLQGALGLDDAQIDALFVAASKL